MYLVAIAWIYVVLMVAVAEAVSSNGTLLGAFVTLLVWGLLPLSVAMYVLGTPARRRARLQAEADHPPGEPGVEPAPQPASEPAQHAQLSAQLPAQDRSADHPDSRGLPAGDAIAPERKEA